MNEDRVVGTAKNLGGKAQEGLDRVTGDTKSQVEGVINQAAGAAQDLYGVASENYIRAYRWCSPPRIGCAMISPTSSTRRVQGASFPSAR
jgi:uncharacterized protein YjbJ (UPF0337 family)